jgi:hypothetical protein
MGHQIFRAPAAAHPFLNAIFISTAQVILFADIVEVHNILYVIYD